MVEANGEKGRFDQVVGHGWFVIGLNADPKAALTSEQLEQLAMLEGRTAKIGAPGTACDAVDVEGTYARWLDGIDATYVLLRPDFYVAATTNSAGSLQQRFDEVMEKLHVTDRELA